jgi:inosine-uridine nucleoside N-ribohydrolase
MARKVILDVDPGVADAMAVCLALNAPRLEVVAVTATGGTVSPQQATSNVQAMIEQLDPARWPRIGAADRQQPLRTGGWNLCGNDGFCGARLGVAETHHRRPSSKVIADEIRAAPGEVTLITCGPLSNIASVLQRESDLATQIGHLIIVGGTLHGPGNVTAAAEFNIYCDAEAAKHVMRSPVTKTLVPLGLTSQVMLDYDLIHQLPDESTRTGSLLRVMLPGLYHAYRQHLGLENVLVHEVVGVVLALQPELFSTESFFCDVETGGTLTYGATVIDDRHQPEGMPNTDVVVKFDADAVRDAILQGLHQ